MRPVVIYGGVSDIAQERLLREVNDLYESPPSTLDGGPDEEISKSGIVKVCNIYPFFHPVTTDNNERV